jgi:hypothetical protein
MTTDASWFDPFFNVDAEGNELPDPDGIIERGIPECVMQSIKQLRDGKVCRPYPLDCFVVAPAWLRLLQPRHPDMLIEQDGDPGSEGATSGYYVDECGIRPHLWVVVGPRRQIFDPTAYQFDESKLGALALPETRHLSRPLRK